MVRRLRVLLHVLPIVRQNRERHPVAPAVVLRRKGLPRHLFQDDIVDRATLGSWSPDHHRSRTHAPRPRRCRPWLTASSGEIRTLDGRRQRSEWSRTLSAWRRGSASNTSLASMTSPLALRRLSIGRCRQYRKAPPPAFAHCRYHSNVGGSGLRPVAARYFARSLPQTASQAWGPNGCRNKPLKVPTNLNIQANISSASAPSKSSQSNSVCSS